MHLFVYGTLMDKSPRRMLRTLAEQRGVTVVNLGPACTPGILYDMGWFPALTHGDGVVHGELFVVPDSLIERLDQYEGAPRLYTRQEVAVTLGAGNDTRTAWATAYFFVLPPDRPDGPPHSSQRIEDGDWLAHQAAKRG